MTTKHTSALSDLAHLPPGGGENIFDIAGWRKAASSNCQFIVVRNVLPHSVLANDRRAKMEAAEKGVQIITL